MVQDVYDHCTADPEVFKKLLEDAKKNHCIRAAQSHVKELSVTCIMLHISHLHQVLNAFNWKKQFVFVNPCVVSGKTMAGEKSKSMLLARKLEEAMLEQLILIPYNIGALKIYETTQRRRRTNPVWKVVQSPQQPTNVECGFYVMRYMNDLIRDQSTLKKQNFGKKRLTRKPNLMKCELNGLISY